MSVRPVRRLCVPSAVAVLLAAGACNSPIDDAALEAFHARLGAASFTVYPAFVRGRESSSWDVAAAGRIAAVLNDDGCGKAVASEAQVSITGEVHMDQSRMWRESAAEFSAWIAAHPPETDYAILPEYVGAGPAREAVGVHAYVVDRAGTLVDGELLNSHQEIFATAHPRTAADCTEVLVAALRLDWVPLVKR